jgi:hypothetical protein
LDSVIYILKLKVPEHSIGTGIKGCLVLRSSEKTDYVLEELFEEATRKVFGVF